MNELQSRLDALYNQQQIDWPFYKEAVESLKNVKTRSLILKGAEIILQNNPARIKSTTAKLEKITERACFLCASNRPKEQSGFDVLNSRYEVLVNPYPVLPKHFTVVSKDHSPQILEDCIEDFVCLVAELPDSAALIFNGALAGASAPDHKHFQILQKADLPINKIINFSRFSNSKLENEIEVYGASYLAYCSESKDGIISALMTKLSELVSINTLNPGLVNLIAWREAGKLIVILVPRKSHRPSCYFATGNEQIMISPAAIELSGLVVIPRIEDFEKIDAGDLKGIFKEVCF